MKNVRFLDFYYFSQVLSANQNITAKKIKNLSNARNSSIFANLAFCTLATPRLKTIFVLPKKFLNLQR
jgi:hypothetical protein